MIFEIFKWVIALLSLTGTVLNIKKKKVCFFIWLFTNICWTIIDLIHGVYSQAFLQFIYVGLSVWGIMEWRRDK